MPIPANMDAMEFVVVVAGVLLALWLQDWGERRRANSRHGLAEDSTEWSRRSLSRVILVLTRRLVFS